MKRYSLVDTHCHLNDPAFAGDMEGALSRARDAGLGALVCVGWSPESSAQAVRLAEAYPEVYAAVGVHPNYSATAKPDWEWTIRRLARHPKVVAIGETGLDFYRKRSPVSIQRQFLFRQLDIAGELGLPVVIHSRDASPEVAEILAGWCETRRDGPPPGVLHCFSGDAEGLRLCEPYGFLVSFAGPLTFPGATSLAEAAARASTESVVVETDAPYLAPLPYRGQRNEPSWLAETLRRLAEARGASLNEMASQTTLNALRLFSRMRLADHNRGR